MLIYSFTKRVCAKCASPIKIAQLPGKNELEKILYPNVFSYRLGMMIRSDWKILTSFWLFSTVLFTLALLH